MKVKKVRLAIRHVLSTAIERTKPLSGKNRVVASAIKNVMYHDAIEALARFESF